MKAVSARFTHPSLDGIHLHTLTWGSSAKPALVLLHGGGANVSWWTHLAPALAERFHVTALDFRGHGDSDYPEEVEKGGFDVDLRALLDHLAKPDAVLVGHSMGAHVALRHAAASSATRAIVLLEISRGAGAQLRRGARLALALRRSYPSAQEAISRFRFLPSADHADPALREHIARRSVGALPDGRFSYKFDPRWFGLPSRAPANAGDVGCPTLILRGAESRLLTPEGAQQLANEIPGAEWREIEGAGHNLHLDRPESVLEALEHFLARHP
ncbi:MAG: alpha/beta hydrolase [Deltaproteobacteria bacterium]|nr:alpha/beta hydrolase [Deltaproteobacteria bacterium]MBW2419086.1 alpha/beta hydrolase [Deltaproteobacteria bacterium]